MHADKGALSDVAAISKTLIDPVEDALQLVHAIVPPAHARQIAQTISSRGGLSVTLLNLDEAGHFELIAPWTPAGADTVRAIVGR